MSEFFSGITFPWQKVTPSDDASVRRSVLADGILSGCEISYIGSTLTMGAGLLIGCGRQFRHTAVQNFPVTGASSGYARLVITIDTTKASTKDTFDQIGTAIEYATALDGFTQLRQDDINEAGTVYQMQVCVVSLGAGGISGIVLQPENTDKYVSKSRVVNDFTTTEGGFVADARALKELNDSKLSMELLWENGSPSSEFPPQTVSIDLSEYQEIRIAYNRSTNTQRENFINIMMGKSATINDTYPASDSAPLCMMRICDAVTTGVEFGDTYKQATNTTKRTTDNLSIIPIRIYGIKGVSE